MSVANDLELYDRDADAWWGQGRSFRSLRSVGKFHLGLIEREWGASLRGARVADLGCGGGYMALHLDARGARVTGIDRSAKSLAAARQEALRRGASARFLEGDLLSTPLEGQAFDLVLMNDVLEHVEHPDRAVLEAGRLLRPGGRLFINTFDRSRLADLTVVRLAEGLGLVPRGTHDARLFVRPSELASYAARAGLSVDRLAWERPALLRTALTWTIHLTHARRGIAYSAFLSKTDR